MGRIVRYLSNEEVLSLRKQNSTESQAVIVKAYEPLINKLTKQMYEKNCGRIAWDEIKSMAYEGILIAIEKYDPERETGKSKRIRRKSVETESKTPMTFTQFAAWSITINIRTRLSEETRVVRMTAYMQKKAGDTGKSTFQSVSFERGDSQDEHTEDRKIYENLKNTLYSTPSWEDGDLEQYIFSRIEGRFGATESELFYRFYGLQGRDEAKVMEMAKELGVTSGRISQRIKKIVDYIKKDEELCEAIAKWLGLEN